jgi:hypothetical protein
MRCSINHNIVILLIAFQLSATLSNVVAPPKKTTLLISRDSIFQKVPFVPDTLKKVFKKVFKTPDGVDIKPLMVCSKPWINLS